MAIYLDKSVIEGLQPIEGNGKPLKERYQYYRSQSRPFALVGHYVGVSELVIDVSSEAEFTEFETQYSQGRFTERNYYTVHPSLIK